MSMSHQSNHICIYLLSLSGGGAERVMVTLANAFVSLGYEVDLVLAIRSGPYLNLVNQSVRIIDLKAGRGIKSLLPLCKYLQHEKPTVMLTALTPANLIAILARILSRVNTRLIISERNVISMEASNAKSIFSRAAYALVKFFYPFADHIITVSKVSATDLLNYAKLTAETVSTIYNPFDLTRIQSLSMEQNPHPWFDDLQRPVLLAIGRLTEQKGFPTLLKALAKLKKIRPVRLIILGEGKLKVSLEKLINELGLTSDDVQICGFTTNPYSYMSRCRAFILSSRWEGLPGVLIEAMACGAPVISTDCLSGPSEILEDGRWGKLVPVDDEDALAAEIEVVLSTPLDKLPDVKLRAAEFDLDRGVKAYLRALGLPSRWEKI